MAAPWRPDPSKGVFETLLVLDGHPVEPDAHLVRLRASLTALYPHLDGPTVGRLLGGSPAGRRAEALRTTVAPQGRGGDLVAKVERRAASGRFATESGSRSTTRPVALRSLALAGGLGPHKWADRSLLNEAQAGLPEGALPLIVDEDGTVLEASRANVFAVRGGVLLTPPLDGRILPGVTRMRVLRIAETLGIEAREEPLWRDDLLTADEAFLTGSLRGVEPAVALDEEWLAAGGEITERLAAELYRAWTDLHKGALMAHLRNNIA